MKISNVTVLNTNLTNNTAKISFTISEATENVNVYLKINNEEYKAIFFNKANGYSEYTTNVSRGVNNLLLKATDSTTEYISEPIQVLLKEAPSIKNLKCSYSDSTGKYILNFAFNGDSNFKYNIYLKLDTNDYIEVLSNQISGDKTIEQTSTMGEHTCILKVSDGYNDYTFSPFQFEITNHKPILSKVLVTDITNNGEAYIYYSTKDIESSTLTHKLTIGTTETVITPTQVDNFYSYKVTGLSEGTFNCMISISDGIDTVSSDIFTIEVFSDTTDKKELLRRAKIRYDSAYQQLRDIIVSVISDLKYDYDIENGLIAKAQDNYKIEYSNFNKISQQSIDTIGTNKVNVTRQDLETQINDVDNAVDTLETTMNGVFKDGILDESEKKILEENLNLVAKEKADVDRDYETLYNNEDLLDPAKTKLQTKYNDFTTVHTTLATTVNDIINKIGIIDNTDKSNIDTAFENWRVALGDYRNASLEAIDSIAKKKADDSADVVDKKWAEIILDPDIGIQAQVGNLSTTVNGFDQRITNVEITTEGVSSTVSSMQSTVDGFDNRITTAESNITQLSNKITSTVMTTDDVKSIIEQSPSSVRIGFNGISDNVVINSSGLTVNQGAIACDQLCTPSGHDPIIYLFGNDGNCAIDATKQYNSGWGTAIRLKWDNYNYYYISDNAAVIYQYGYESFTFRTNEDERGISEIVTPNGTLAFRSGSSNQYTTHRLTFDDMGVAVNGDSFYQVKQTGSMAARTYTACDGTSISFGTDNIKLHIPYKSQQRDYAVKFHLTDTNSFNISSVGGTLLLASHGLYWNGDVVLNASNYTNYCASSSHSHSGYASSSHSHSGYASSSHSHHRIESDYSSSYCVNCWAGSSGGEVGLQAGGATVFLANYGAFSLYPTSSNIDLGASSSNSNRWRYIYAQNSLNTSDIKYKENVIYIDEILSQTHFRISEETTIDTNNQQETLFLDFIKNDFRPALFNYIEKEGEKQLADEQIGFIANDIIDTEIGQTFLYDCSEDGEQDIMFSQSGYTTVIARALQEEIMVRENKILELENRIAELENKLNK